MKSIIFLVHHLLLHLWASSSNQCLAALNIGAGVEQPFDSLIVQNCQAVQSMGRSMDWALEDNMVDGLFFCATFTGRRGSHTAFVQTGAETPETGAEAFKPDPGSSWEGHSWGYLPVSGMKMRSLVRLSAHPAFHWWSAQCVPRMLLLSDKLMSFCAAGTNGCLDLRRRASTLDGQVSAEWSRFPGSMARRPRDSVAPMRQSSAGWMPARIGRLSVGVGRKHPVTVGMASLMVGSIRRVWALRNQTRAQYSEVECTKTRVAVRRVVAPAPQPEAASSLTSATRDVSFLRSDSRCLRYVSYLFNVTPRHLGSEQKGRVSLLKLTFSLRLASLLLRWKAADTVFVVLIFSFQVWRYSVRFPCPCSVLLPLPASLHQQAWLLGRQHVRTFWRRCLASQRCTCWREGAPGHISVRHRSWGVVTCSFCSFRW